MHNSVFKLITIKEVKSQFPFLMDHEGFDYFEEWNNHVQKYKVKFERLELSQYL